MKTKFNSLYYKAGGLSLLFFLMMFVARSQAPVNVMLKSCSSTNNTLDFDIIIINPTTNNSFILQSGAYGLDFNYSGVRNGGNISIAYVPGTSQLSLSQSAFDSINTTINPTSHSIRINAQVVTNPVDGTPLSAGVPFRVGTFRLTNTAPWSTDSTPDFSWVLATIALKTQTKFTIYQNGSPTASAYNATANDVSFSTACEPMTLNSQWNYFSVANQYDFSSVTNKIIKAGEGKYLAIGAYGGSQTKAHPFVFGVNDSGKILFDHKPFAGSAMENYDVTDIVKTSDSNFVFTGHGDYCDVGFGEVYAEKIDSAGNVLWSKIYQFNSFYDSNHHLAELSNGQFVFVLKDILFFMDSNGDSLNTVSLTFDSVQSVAVTPDNYLLIGYQNNGIEKRDLTGVLSLQPMFQGGVSNIIVNNSNEYIFSSSTMLYHTDSMLVGLDSADLQLFISEITDIEKDSLGYQLLGDQKVIHVDTLFNADTAKLDIPATLLINDIAVDNDRIILTGEELTNTPQVKSKHPIVKSYALNYETGEEVRDAGVVDISSDSIILNPLCGSCPTLSFNLFATIKNFGPDTLRSIAVNFYMMPLMAICNYNEVTTVVTGVNIAPQDTSKIYVGAFLFPFMAATSPLNLCVWSSAPNKHIDSDHTNDMFCKNLPVSVVAVEENKPDTEIKISPNPATDILQINIPMLNKSASVTLSDISGKQIFERTINESGSSLSLKELKPGMYFLKFNQGDESLTKRIIKL